MSGKRQNAKGDQFDLVAAKPHKHVTITQHDTNDTSCDMIVISATDTSKSGVIMVLLDGDDDGGQVAHHIDIDHPFVGHIKRVLDTGTTLADADLQGFLF